MYAAIGNMGFKAGNILEPSCGIGNFFGRSSGVAFRLSRSMA